MKTTIALLCLFAMLFSSCGGSRYGHYKYSKKKHHQSAKIKRNKTLKLELLQAKKTNLVLDTVFNTVIIGSTDIAPKDIWNRTNVIPNKSKLRKTVTSLTNNDSATNNNKAAYKSNEELKPNPLAALSFWLAISGLMITILGVIIPYIGILGVLLGVAAFVTSAIAISQIQNTPNTYNNMGIAIVALVIGSFFMLGLLLLFLYGLILFLMLLGR